MLICLTLYITYCILLLTHWIASGFYIYCYILTLFILFPETHIDAFPNSLTPSDAILQLIDSGHHINVGCVPVLRPEREVDIIISLDYSWNPDNIFRVKVKLCFADVFESDCNAPFVSSYSHVNRN